MASGGRAVTRFAWTVVGYNVAVVAWGAFVRATGSGAGCGRHWPTCRGEVIPRAPALETVIEYAHRATSGLALVSAVALVAWTWRALPRGHASRRAAAAGLGLMVVEALLGAALVLYGWVARDASPERGWVMAIHLTNTLLLLGALTLAAAWSGSPAGSLSRIPRPLVGALVLAAGLTLVASASGAIAALGDTLYPATSLGEGLRQDLDASARLLLRLRLLHPPLAVAAALAIAWASRQAVLLAAGAVGRVAAAAAGLALVQICAGVANLLLLAPVWMQIVHLALADLAWIALATLAARALAPGGEAREALPSSAA